MTLSWWAIWKVTALGVEYFIAISLLIYIVTFWSILICQDQLFTSLVILLRDEITLVSATLSLWHLLWVISRGLTNLLPCLQCGGCCVKLGTLTTEVVDFDVMLLVFKIQLLEDWVRARLRFACLVSAHFKVSCRYKLCLVTIDVGFLESQLPAVLGELLFGLGIAF